MGRVTPALAGGARVASSVSCDEAIPFPPCGVEIASQKSLAMTICPESPTHPESG